jgi:hypothetical protein
MLQRLVAPRIAQPAMHRLHGLPLALVEQTAEIATGGLALRAPREAVGELIGKLAEPRQRADGSVTLESVQNSRH